jgi:hypothetical protein
MRKPQLSLLGILLCLAVSSYAQTPEKKSRAVVFKFTETWCGPCGDWGWQTAEETIAQLGDKGYYIGVMGSSSPSTMNANCYSSFESNYNVPGYPTFLVKEDQSSYTSSQVMALVNAFAATTPAASPAANFTISGNTLNVTAKAKFWAATTGEYYMAAFLVEDGIMASQNGQSGTVAHHHIMRGSMETNLSPWGQLLANGSVANNAEFTKNYSIALDPSWVKAKLEVYVVIFKKNAGKYEFVNAIKGKSGTTSIADIQGLESATLFPNPTEGATHLQTSLKEAMNLSIRVTDPLGRVVYTSGQLKLQAGTNDLTIPTEGFSNGIYMVSLISDKGQMTTQRLVVSK